MRLTLIVIFSHLFLLTIVGLHRHSQPKVSAGKKVAVHTVILQPPPPRRAPPRPAPTKASAPAKPKPKPAPAKPKPAPKKTDSNQQKLLSMMQSTLSELERKPTSQKPSVGKLPSESIKAFQTDYNEQLILYLQHLLTLPENGDVKCALTLSREGKVISLNILSSASEKNRVYVEKTLPTLVLPPFGKQFQGEKNHKFAIALTANP